MSKRAFSKSNRKSAGDNCTAGLLALQKILSQPGNSVVRQLIAAAADPTSINRTKDPDWAWTVAYLAFVIRWGERVETDLALKKATLKKSKQIAAVYSLVCLRAQDTLQAELQSGETKVRSKSFNELRHKLATQKNTVAPAQRRETKQRVAQPPSQRAKKQLEGARDTLHEAGDQENSIKHVDAAIAELEVSDDSIQGQLFVE